MNARQTFFCACLLPTLLTLATGTAQGGDKPRRPNVIIILSDDQGWGDFSINP